MRYLLISNLYNEEKNVEELFETVEAQTKPPDLWLIVDDGSTDRTYVLLTKRAKTTPLNVRIWRGRIKRKPDYDTIGISIRKALLSLDEETYVSFDYYCVLDADSRVGPDYFQVLLSRMDSDPTIGMASGAVYFGDKIERTRNDLARGSGRATKAQIWRSVPRERMPDVVSDAFFNAKTKMMGYSCKMYDDLRIVQRRPTRQLTSPGEYRKGKLMAMFWYNPAIVMIKAFLTLLSGRNPVPLLRGYASGLSGPRIQDADVRAYFGHRVLSEILRRRLE